MVWPVQSLATTTAETLERKIAQCEIMAVTSLAGCNRGLSGTTSTCLVLADTVSHFDNDVPCICVD